MEHPRQAGVAPSSPASPPPVGRRSHTTADGQVAVLAAGLAALGWSGARLAGIGLEVRSGAGPSQVAVVSVVVTALVVTIAGAGLLRVLERRTTRARRVWTVLAVGVLALSCVGPLSATRPAAGLVLAGLHLVVGAVVIVGLRTTHAPGRTARGDGA